MGASGCLLLFELMKAFPRKKILICDRDLKTKNDKTWCFWEKERGNLDEIVFKKWNDGEFYSQNVEMQFSLYPYSYKMIRSIDLYAFALNKIKSSSYVDFEQIEVKDIEESINCVKIKNQSNVLLADMVFDSRYMDEDINLENNRTILQHFKGWFVKFDKDVLQENSFTMMDYQHGAKQATNFMYVLPLNAREALFESTYFSPTLVGENVYDKQIEEYLAINYPSQSYTILHTEQGIIPMTMYPFFKHSTSKIIKIGMAGGAVKPSSGYSFQFSRKIAKLITQNLQQGKQDLAYKQMPKYRFYDKVFLGVLQNNNALGNEIFAQMYKKNSIQNIFRFLDEESSLFDDFKIISSFMAPKLVTKFIKEVF